MCSLWMSAFVIPFAFRDSDLTSLLQEKNDSRFSWSLIGCTCVSCVNMCDPCNVLGSGLSLSNPNHSNIVGIDTDPVYRCLRRLRVQNSTPSSLPAWQVTRRYHETCSSLVFSATTRKQFHKIPTASRGATPVTVQWTQTRRQIHV